MCVILVVRMEVDVGKVEDVNVCQVTMDQDVRAGDREEAGKIREETEVETSRRRFRIRRIRTRQS